MDRGVGDAGAAQITPRDAHPVSTMPRRVISASCIHNPQRFGLLFNVTPHPAARCKGSGGTEVFFFFCKLSSPTLDDSEKPLVSSVC